MCLYTPTTQFPPIGVNCFDQFMSIREHGYADPSFNLPTFDMQNVTSFKCSSQKGFSQYEIHGIDANQHTFYVHAAAGGMAASGSDMYFDYCRLQDGVVVISKKLSGRTSAPVKGSCTYIDSFPTHPTSMYSYSK